MEVQPKVLHGQCLPVLLASVRSCSKACRLEGIATLPMAPARGILPGRSSPAKDPAPTSCCPSPFAAYPSGKAGLHVRMGSPLLQQATLKSAHLGSFRFPSPYLPKQNAHSMQLPARKQAQSPNLPMQHTYSMQLPARKQVQSPLTVGELTIGTRQFEPNDPLIRSKLLAELHVSPWASIQAAKAAGGGLNSGVWYLKDGLDDLVLKLVKFDAKAPAEFRESEAFLRMAQTCPGITGDQMLSFPRHLFHVLDDRRRRCFDLIVMKRAPGEMLAHIVASKVYGGRIKELRSIIRTIGACLCRFHKTYGNKQHSDLGAQNIFYDESTKKVTFIDLGGMGLKTDKTDVQKFTAGLNMLASFYGSNLEDCASCFEEGYRSEVMTSPLRTI